MKGSSRESRGAPECWLSAHAWRPQIASASPKRRRGPGVRPRRPSSLASSCLPPDGLRCAARRQFPVARPLIICCLSLCRRCLICWLFSLCCCRRCLRVWTSAAIPGKVRADLAGSPVPVLGANNLGLLAAVPPAAVTAVCSAVCPCQRGSAGRCCGGSVPCGPQLRCGTAGSGAGGDLPAG